MMIRYFWRAVRAVAVQVERLLRARGVFRLWLWAEESRWWAIARWIDVEYGLLCPTCHGIGRVLRVRPRQWAHACRYSYFVPCVPCRGRGR